MTAAAAQPGVFGPRIGVTKADGEAGGKGDACRRSGGEARSAGVEKNLLTYGLEERVKNGLEALYDLFAKAPWLGSLIDPRRAGADIFREGFDKLEPLLVSILATADTDDAREMAVAAQGMAKAAESLTCDFTLAVTNVPFLGRGKQSDDIKSHIEPQSLTPTRNLISPLQCYAAFCVCCRLEEQ